MRIQFVKLAAVGFSYVLCGLLAAETGNANQIENIKVNGFLTAVAAQSNQGLNIYAPGLDEIYAPEVHNSGISGDHVSFGSVSRMGLELRYLPADDWFTMTGKLSAYGSDDWIQKVHALYGTFKFRPSTSINLGRMSAPLFRDSTSSENGREYVTVSPPSEIYQFITPSFDGIQFYHEASPSFLKSKVTFEYGRIHRFFEGPGIFKDTSMNSFRGASLEVFHQQWAFFASKHIGRFSDDTPTSLTDFEPISPHPTFFAGDEIDINDFGATYGTEKWFVNYEFGKFDAAGSIIPGYIARNIIFGGYMGRITPYFSLGSLATNANDQVLPILRKKQRSQSVGLVFNFDKHVDFKASLTHVYNFGETNGLFISSPGNKPAFIYMVAADVTF